MDQDSLFLPFLSIAYLLATVFLLQGPIKSSDVQSRPSVSNLGSESFIEIPKVSFYLSTSSSRQWAF